MTLRVLRMSAHNNFSKSKVLRKKKPELNIKILNHSKINLKSIKQPFEIPLGETMTRRTTDKATLSNSQKPSQNKQMTYKPIKPIAKNWSEQGDN